VLFILIGSTIFSFTFTAIDGQIWVEHLFDKLPGGEIGFLVFVNTVIFFLGFFIDFFEIAFILIPLLAPVADKMGIDLVWFGVLLAMNLQTSFLTPPFGFALFYLRSVAPAKDFIDRVTSKRVAGVKTMDIYRGSIPFVIMQILMVAALMMFPGLVTFSLDKKVEVDLDTIEINVQGGSEGGGWGQQSDTWGGGEQTGGGAAPTEPAPGDGTPPAESGGGQDQGFGTTQRGW
jgi:TRAP-type mannitol/chloroaromatic compound transport system permease large subunit